MCSVVAHVRYGGFGPVDLSAAEARRICLCAQGFAKAAPKRPGLADVRRVASRLSAIQIDSVSVLVRAHYLPAYSRLGPYPVDLVDRLAYDRRELFEFDGHKASFIPMPLYPLFRWRMERAANHPYWLACRRRIDLERPGFIEAIEREVADRGPLAFGDLTDQGRRERVPAKYAASEVMGSLRWGSWSDGKDVLEWLHAAGRLAVAGRRRFERLYDLPERVIPAEVLSERAPPEKDAQRALVLLVARALGVATTRDLATYFNLAVAETKARVAELVDEGHLRPARVEGWREQAFVHVDAKAPRVVEARALVTPFDPLVWDRDRIERMFGFRYRIEIYTPAAKRDYGYYVLPFLLGDRLVARVDLKADRIRQTLLVPGAFAEADADLRAVAGALAAELRQMADWLQLGSVDVGERGNLALELKRALRVRGST